MKLCISFKKEFKALLAEFDLIKTTLAELKTLIIQQGETMAGELQKLQDDVAAETTVIQSAITLLNNLNDLLKAAGTDPVKLTALSNTIEQNSAALAAAVAANTPGAPGGGSGDPNA